MKLYSSGRMAAAWLIVAHIAISDSAEADAQANGPGAESGAPPCKPIAGGIWGDVDPNLFYMYDQETNTARQLRCPEGRGFFNGFGYYGCIPYDEWPACIAADGALQVMCDDEHLLQTWQALNPNHFYMCQPERLEPLLASCEPGKGFVSAWVGDGGPSSGKITGCASWEKWRVYMGCEQFY